MKTIKERVIKAVETLNVPVSYAIRIVNLIPTYLNDKGQEVRLNTVGEALEMSDDLKNLYEKEVDSKNILDLVKEMEEVEKFKEVE